MENVLQNAMILTLMDHTSFDPDILGPCMSDFNDISDTLMANLSSLKWQRARGRVVKASDS